MKLLRPAALILLAGSFATTGAAVGAVLIPDVDYSTYGPPPARPAEVRHAAPVPPCAPAPSAADAARDGKTRQESAPQENGRERSEGAGKSAAAVRCAPTVKR